MNYVQHSNMLTAFYFVLTMFIVTKCISGYAVDKSRTDNNVQHTTSIVAISAPETAPKSSGNSNYSATARNGESSDIEIGRKKYSFGKKKKYRKFLYPVILGLFITKMIMFPMFVKAVTILSSASFVFSKMSLLASLILGLKFFLTNSSHNSGDSKVEIVHVPLKKYGGGDWDRETSENKYFVNTIGDNPYEHDFRPTQYIL